MAVDESSTITERRYIHLFDRHRTDDAVREAMAWRRTTRDTRAAPAAARWKTRTAAARARTTSSAMGTAACWRSALSPASTSSLRSSSVDRFTSESFYPRLALRTTGSGPIAFPCEMITAGPGARCGSGQETQILGALMRMRLTRAELGYITQVTRSVPIIGEPKDRRQADLRWMSLAPSLTARLSRGLSSMTATPCIGSRLEAL